MFFSFYKQFRRALVALASELKQNGINQLKLKPWDVKTAWRISALKNKLTNK